MSYRTKLNGHIIFGNGERYLEWFEFIKSQGIEIDSEENYSGEINDFMGMLEVIETITLKIAKENMDRKKELLLQLGDVSYTKTLEELNESYGACDIFDFSYIQENLDKMNNQKNKKFNHSLFDELSKVIHQSYAFFPYSVYLACKDKLEEQDYFTTPGHLHSYTLKVGETLHVEAY